MDDQTPSRFRLRVLGAFSAEPRGARYELSAAGFAAAMAAAALDVEVEVPDRLGPPGTRRLRMRFERPRQLALAEVVGAVEPLAALRELGERLAAGQCDAPTALAAVEALVGDGALTAALREALRPASAPTLDDLVAASDRRAAGATSAVAIDAFVRGLRGPAERPQAASPPVTGARAARAAIEGAVFATAGDVLGDALVVRLEGAWRGLKLLVDQCSANARVGIEVVDVMPADVPAALARDLPDDDSERPDLYVVCDAVADVATLEALAREGEELSAPVVVAVAPALLGAADAAALALAADAPGGVRHEAWEALRADEASRWLCPVVNRVVVAAEGSGPTRRVAFASPALALAAMLAASFRDTRGFARILGAAGALDAPATWDLPSGRDAGTAVPTESFHPLRIQAALAALGLLALGSPRDSSKVTLSVTPTARAAPDAVPLPAQILTGQIVRFASWVRRELPAGASDAELAGMVEQAAHVFLLAGMGDGARLRAGVGRDDGGRRVVEIAASLSAELAAIPLQLAFTLPLE